MSVSKLGQRRQVVIPKDICDDLDLKEGDYLEVSSVEGAVVIKPKKLVDVADVLSPEEEQAVEEGFRQLKRGQYAEWKKLKDELDL